MLDFSYKQRLAVIPDEPPLCELPVSDELLSKFTNKSETLHCVRDQVLFSKGESSATVYLVRSGKVTLLLPLSRTRAMGFHAVAGALVGLPAAFSNEPYSMTAIALKNSEIASLGREEFCKLIAGNPSLSMEVLRMLAAETRNARMAIIASSSNGPRRKNEN